MKKQLVSSVLLLVTGSMSQDVTAGKVTYIHTDAQGTPVMESDEQGNITARFDYTPYGVPVQSMSGAPDGPGYTGHVNDPDTGFVYMQARYYDPEMGRFLSPDPVHPSAGSLMEFGRYLYSYLNPMVFHDPDGRSPDTEQGATRMAMDLNRKMAASGQTGAYSVVWNGEGPNGYSVSISTYAALDHAGLSGQAEADYAAKGSVKANVVCITPSIAAALIVGDVSDKSGSEGLNQFKDKIDLSEKALEVLSSAPSESLSHMAEGAKFVAPGLKVALAVPATINNQQACTADQEKDGASRKAFENQRLQ